MSKAYRYILLLSAVATLAIFVHEWLYDVPSSPYTWYQTAMELLVFGTLCTALFFGIFSGIYFCISRLVKALR